MTATTLDTFLEEAALTETMRNDLDIPLNALVMLNDGKIKSMSYGELTPSKVTINKLCNMYKLSPSHINTLVSAGRYDIVADTFNHFLLRDRRPMKLRLIGDRIKGIVGTNYKPFDDYDLFSIVNEYLKENNIKQQSIQIVNHNDEYTRIRFALDTTAKNMTTSIDDGLDVVKGGFEITNSEIGNKAMGMNTLLYRLICSNGMMELIGDGDNEEIFHKRGDTFNPFSKKPIIDHTLTNILDKADQNLNLFQKTQQIKVIDPKQEILKIGRKYKIHAHTDQIQENFDEENVNNYYGIINAITSTARDVEDYRIKSKLELVANNVMKQAVLT